jgi:hypothetical protein
MCLFIGMDVPHGNQFTMMCDVKPSKQNEAHWSFYQSIATQGLKRVVSHCTWLQIQDTHTGLDSSAGRLVQN